MPHCWKSYVAAQLCYRFADVDALSDDQSDLIDVQSLFCNHYRETDNLYIVAHRSGQTAFMPKAKSYLGSLTNAWNHRHSLSPFVYT